jgi:VWFA-related protein
MRSDTLILRLFLVLLATPLAAQDLPVFRTDTNLALIHFHIIHKGRYATTVKPEDLILLEDGVPRKFTVFENAAYHRSLPVELTLLFDFSGSVVNSSLYDPLAFQEGLLDQLENVSIAVYGFDNKLYRYSAPTNNVPVLNSAFNALAKMSGPREEIAYHLPNNRKLHPGGTWIYASILEASRAAAATPGNVTRLMLVYSDGLDDTAMHPEEIADLIREREIAVYPVALGHRRLAEREEYRVLEFARLGELTGGRSYDPDVVNHFVMKQILEGLVGSLRTEYIIGFSPEPSPTPGKHKLEVRLRDKQLGAIVGGTRAVTH